MDQKEKTQQSQLMQYQAIIRIDAVINGQLSNGQWHPRTVFHDNFFLRLEGTSEVEVVKDLKEKLQSLKDKWIEDGGEIGVYHNDAK